MNLKILFNKFNDSTNVSILFKGISNRIITLVNSYYINNFVIKFIQGILDQALLSCVKNTYSRGRLLRKVQ